MLARTSDQPLQVHDSIELFSHSLIEALVLVVVVALIGFWSWRTAILIAVSMPITLAITFGVIHTLGIDLQQVSIASLIIALGLLVDVPVVSGDAIVRELGDGKSRVRRGVAGTNKAVQNDGLRHRYQYRLLSSISAVARGHREIPVQSAYRH